MTSSFQEGTDTAVNLNDLSPELKKRLAEQNPEVAKLLGQDEEEFQKRKEKIVTKEKFQQMKAEILANIKRNGKYVPED